MYYRQGPSREFLLFSFRDPTFKNVVASVVKWIVLLQQPLLSTRKTQEAMARTASIESLLTMIRSGLAEGDNIKLGLGMPEKKRSTSRIAYQQKRTYFSLIRAGRSTKRTSLLQPRIDFIGATGFVKDSQSLIVGNLFPQAQRSWL